MVQHTQHDCDTVVSVWQLIGQSSVRFSTRLVPFLIVFGWGMVAGKMLTYREPSHLDKALDYAEKRAQQILQEHSYREEEGSQANERLHNSDGAGSSGRRAGIDARGVRSYSSARTSAQ